MSIATTYSARFSVLQVEIPGGATTPAGVLLVDPASDRLYLRLRRDWKDVAPAESEVLASLEDDLEQKAAELGAAQLLDYLTDTLSNTLRVTDPRDIAV